MPDASLLLGPFLLGACFNLILYGVCITQAFIYFRTYHKDPKWIRCFVIYLFVLETINTGCAIGLIYEPLILNYGEAKSFKYAPAMLPADGVTTVLISTPAQLFIAWRLRILSQSSIVPLIIAALSIASLVGGTKLSISVALFSEYSRFKGTKSSVIVWLAASAAADLVITGGLFWSLMTRKTGIKATDDNIARILRLTIQTGLVTMLFAVADLTVFLTFSNTALNFIPHLALSKLYTNSLLSTLNARAGWNMLSGQGQEVSVLFPRTEILDMKDDQNGTLAAIELQVQPTNRREDLESPLRFADDRVRVIKIAEGSPYSTRESESAHRRWGPNEFYPNKF